MQLDVLYKTIGGEATCIKYCVEQIRIEFNICCHESSVTLRVAYSLAEIS
jgi:hypothetical protein